MPDSRLSINALVNGPAPTSYTSSATSPSSSTQSPATLPLISWTPSPEILSHRLPPARQLDVPFLPPLSAPQNELLSLSPISSHSSPRNADTPTPTSPQTVIVKTPRGKRHRCNFRGCGRDFTRLSNLKAHWRRHSGEEPYSCMHCTRKFKWRSSLKSHELGCVYEFTKSNSALRWVYVATDQHLRAQGPQEPQAVPRMPVEPLHRPLFRSVTDTFARRRGGIQCELSANPSEQYRQDTALAPIGSNSYV